MAGKTVKIDANLTLQQTKNRCIVEQNKGFQLQNIERSTVTQDGETLMINKARFESNIEFLPTLDFVELGANNPETIKSQKQAQGWTFISTGPIFVENNITVVMVFARNGQ